MLRDGTLLAASTCIAELFPDAPLEETFTTLAADDTVVSTYNHHCHFTSLTCKLSCDKLGQNLG